MTTRWTLQGRGRQPWAQVLEQLQGCTCAWMDLDALHVGPAPSEPPIATHLWGWSRQQQRYLRARIDENEAYLGILYEDPDDANQGTPVRVVQRAAIMGHQDATAAPGLPAETFLEAELLEIPGPAPVTFVREASRT